MYMCAVVSIKQFASVSNDHRPADCVSANRDQEGIRHHVPVYDLVACVNCVWTFSRAEF